MNLNNIKETATKRKTRVVRSRSERSTLTPHDKVKYVYEVRAEAKVDLVWAFAAITDDGYSYTPKCTPDGRIIFSTKCPIENLREIWNDVNKDLHVMIETLDFANEYTGERYFTKYWDAKTSEKKADLAYYNSDNSDSEDEEEDALCKYCECDPNQEDHLEDCESLQCNKDHED